MTYAEDCTVATCWGGGLSVVQGEKAFSLSRAWWGCWRGVGGADLSEGGGGWVGLI